MWISNRKSFPQKHHFVAMAIDKIPLIIMRGDSIIMDPYRPTSRQTDRRWTLRRIPYPPSIPIPITHLCCCFSPSLKLVLMSMPCAAKASVTVLGSPAAPFLGLENEPWCWCIDVFPLSVAVTDPCVDNVGTAELPPAARRSDGCLVMDETGRSVSRRCSKQLIISDRLKHDWSQSRRRSHLSHP